MIGIVEYIGSTNSGSCMDRKRRRFDSDALIDLAKLHCLSNPPKWHTSLKQHLNCFTTKESKNILSLNDVTQILVDSGFVSILDVYHLSQTCKELHHTTINRQSTWKALCMQEFPSGTKQISPIIIKEKGYKWLYMEWKSSIHSAEAKHGKTIYTSLPPPRLMAEQIMFFIHVNGIGDRPLHKIPIVVTGNDLSPLLNSGKMTFDFPEPVLVPPINGNNNGESESTNNHLHVRIHFLSIADASMCCIYNEAKVLPLHPAAAVVNHQNTDTQIQEEPELVGSTSSSRSRFDPSKESAAEIQAISHEREYIDFGPSEIATYHNCDLRLRNSPAATEIKQRLSCNTTIVLRVGLCLANKGEKRGEKNTSCLSDHTDRNCFVPVTGIRIEVLKYDSTMNTCSLFDSEQMKDQNGGVTILHYLSELQLS